jgi:alanine dehydrogenase
VTRLLTDADVCERLSPAIALVAARRALAEAYSGRLHAPPRIAADLGDAGLVITAGGFAGKRGFRAYLTGVPDAEQAVLVWDEDGRLACCVAGVELGARRTGALGAVAAHALARPDASTVAVVGSGRQAWTQLWALTAVRPEARVRVFSRTEAHRTAFAERADRELGLQTAAVASAREAVEGADIVVLATRSTEPVIESAWVQAGAHVTTVGPKTVSGHEAPRDLADRAVLVATDSPAQAAAYGEPLFTGRPLVHLGGIVSEALPGRTSPDDITLYVSTGLAGSEVVTAVAMLRARGTSSPVIRRHVIVHGRVQGVAFRVSLARVAESHGVAGWVQNRSDGTVEAALEGPVAAVEVVARWCGYGPRGAAVERVETLDEPAEGLHRFEIR